ncbi:MAG: hypothetical protein EBR82_22475 [Caulobacteraceae bacterium]|nr:hypothetical protein [Caulobacteraceae bacterium]
MAITKDIRTLTRRREYLVAKAEEANSYDAQEIKALDRVLPLLEAERLRIHERRAKCAETQPS